MSVFYLSADGGLGGGTYLIYLKMKSRLFFGSSLTASIFISLGCLNELFRRSVYLNPVSECTLVMTFPGDLMTLDFSSPLIEVIHIFCP